ncbi:MAG: pteridine reductase [Myxococcota bacterium]|jgi:pteridine reductase
MKVVVTGAAKRVGAGIVEEFARCGFDVVLHYRSSDDEAQTTAERCRAHGVQVHLISSDLATKQGCQQLIDGVLALWDDVDVLVNNASIFNPCRFEDVDDAEWDRQHNINLRAPMRVSQGLLGALRAGEGGVIVHMVDIGADQPVNHHSAYSTSKAALGMLVKSMAIELAPAIRTVGVSPGQVCWPEEYSEEKRAHLKRRIPMDRAGTPEEIATLVRFLAVEGTYINGAVIPMDGGLSLRYG